MDVEAIVAEKSKIMSLQRDMIALAMRIEMNPKTTSILRRNTPSLNVIEDDMRTPPLSRKEVIPSRVIIDAPSIALQDVGDVLASA